MHEPPERPAVPGQTGVSPHRGGGTARTCRARSSPHRGHRGAAAAPRCAAVSQARRHVQEQVTLSLALVVDRQGRSRTPAGSARRGRAVRGSRHAHPGCALPAHRTGSPPLRHRPRPSRSAGRPQCRRASREMIDVDLRLAHVTISATPCSTLPGSAYCPDYARLSASGAS